MPPVFVSTLFLCYSLNGYVHAEVTARLGSVRVCVCVTGVSVSEEDYPAELLRVRV